MLSYKTIRKGVLDHPYTIHKMKKKTKYPEIYVNFRLSTDSSQICWMGSSEVFDYKSKVKYKKNQNDRSKMADYTFDF